MGVFKYSRVDFLLTCLGLQFLLLDIGLDIWAAVTFYQEKAYVRLSVLLLFLLGSSVLVQAFSWLWYSDESYKRETVVEKRLSRGQLLVLHVLQLGIYIRHASIVEISLPRFFSMLQDPEGLAVFLSHDLSMLRLIEAFSESSPQLVLMVTIILQRGQLDHVTVLKALGSASAIAFSVTMYHRALRSFVPDKKQQPLTSSVVYFLWNLLLISSRLAALALFASVLPCFIFAHFFCSWVILLFFVWRSQTSLMDSLGGEWLYRATVGLIWYFDWFNVVEGRTRYRTLLYHGYILADISLLCGLWCWQMSTEPLYFEISHLSAVIVAISVVAVYILGLFFKVIYYKCFHPNLSKEELKGDEGESPQTGQGPTTRTEGDTDEDASYSGPQLRSGGAGVDVVDCGLLSPPAPHTERCNKRMRKLAENFYS